MLNFTTGTRWTRARGKENGGWTREEGREAVWRDGMGGAGVRERKREAFEGKVNGERSDIPFIDYC